MGGIQQRRGGNNCDNAERTVADYEDILARSRDAAEKSGANSCAPSGWREERLHAAEADAADVPKQIADLIPTDPMGSPLLEPFTKFPRGISRSGANPAQRSRQENLLERRRSGISEAARLRGFDVLARLPRIDRGDCLPNGAAAYAFHVRWQTTTKLTPPQIHEIGLAEVKRIRAQMDRVIALADSRAASMTSRNFCARIRDSTTTSQMTL